MSGGRAAAGAREQSEGRRTGRRTGAGEEGDRGAGKEEGSKAASGRGAEVEHGAVDVSWWEDHPQTHTIAALLSKRSIFTGNKPLTAHWTPCLIVLRGEAWLYSDPRRNPGRPLRGGFNTSFLVGKTDLLGC